jgi:hypothetical protein
MIIILASSFVLGRGDMGRDRNEEEPRLPHFASRERKVSWGKGTAVTVFSL